MPSNINLAILSPNDNAYSETFIQSHKQLPFNVSYYYDGFLPRKLSGKSILENSILQRLLYKLNPVRSELSYGEYSLMRSFKENKINCVLAEYGTTAAESLNVIKKLALPLIVHFHGYDATMIDFIDRYRDNYLRMFEYAKYVIVVSKKMYKDLSNLGCPETKMRLITYGPNELFFDVQPSYSNRQFIAIGRFVDKKAPYLTIAAFKEVLKAYPDAKLIMAGTGPLLNTCINLAKIWKVLGSVNFIGVVTPEQVLGYFADSIAFLQHSIVADNGDSEGTPVAVIEASAAGLPIIASKHAGIPDVIINEETGLLFDELDVDGMVEKIHQLLADKETARKIGTRGKAHIRKNFTIEKYLSSIASLIESVTAHEK